MWYLFLQETHLAVNSECFARSGWGFDCYLSGVETNKNSVAILFNNTFEYKIFEVFRDPDGSYIILDVEIMKKRITLVNVYGPSSGDKPDFFNISNQIDRMGNQLIIAGGDWNVLLTITIDARKYKGYVNRPRSRRKILEIMEKYELVDVWLEVFPEKRGYTRRKFNTVQ